MRKEKKDFPSLLILGNARHGVVFYLNSIYLYIKDYGNYKYLYTNRP